MRGTTTQPAEPRASNAAPARSAPNTAARMSSGALIAHPPRHAGLSPVRLTDCRVLWQVYKCRLHGTAAFTGLLQQTLADVIEGSEEFRDQPARARQSDRMGFHPA